MNSSVSCEHSVINGADEIIIVDRFYALRKRLLVLLAELGEDDWGLPTAAPRWSVKDVTAHLLGGDIAILSGKRDGFHSAQKFKTYDQLVELVDRLNREWVLAARRLSLAYSASSLPFAALKSRPAFPL